MQTLHLITSEEMAELQDLVDKLLSGFWSSVNDQVETVSGTEYFETLNRIAHILGLEVNNDTP